MLPKYKAVVFLSLSLLFLKIGAIKVNYCKSIYCGKTPHTICQLQHDCSLNLNNCRDFEKVLLNDSDRTLLLDAHNKLRSLVATGKASPGLGGYKLPTASDMKEMVWDKELEFISQCWANQCSFGHDECRKKSDGTSVGQNLAGHSSADNIMEDMIKGFYSEIKFITKSDLTSFGGSNYTIGHFTQLAHYNSSQLGCGRVRYSNKKGTKMTTLVCNYAEAGNLLGSKVYTKGEPCASCPKSCHPTHPGLCKTPPSTSRIPNICPYSKNKNCKPILLPGSDKGKSGAQKLTHGIFNYFGPEQLFTATAASFYIIVAF